MEGNQRVLGLALVNDPDGEETDTNDKRGNDVSLSPLRFDTTSECEGDEEESDRGYKEERTDNVELPEQVGSKDLEAELLEGGLVTGQCASLGSPVASPDEHKDDENGRD